MTTDFEAANAPKNKTVFATNNCFEIQKPICVLGWVCCSPVSWKTKLEFERVDYTFAGLFMGEPLITCR